MIVTISKEIDYIISDNIVLDLPDQCPIYRNYLKKKKVGTARNVRYIKPGIIAADLTLLEEYSKHTFILYDLIAETYIGCRKIIIQPK